MLHLHVSRCSYTDGREQFGLNALLKGTSTDFTTSNLSVTGTMLLTTRLPDANVYLPAIHQDWVLPSLEVFHSEDYLSGFIQNNNTILFISGALGSVCLCSQQFVRLMQTYCQHRFPTHTSHRASSSGQSILPPECPHTGLTHASLTLFWSCTLRCSSHSQRRPGRWRYSILL